MAASSVRLYYDHPVLESTHGSDMYLCKVVGAAVATRKSDRLRESRLLIVARVDLGGLPTGAAEEIALDPGLDAGTGDFVLVAKEGAVVADLFDRALAPTDPAMPANVVVVAVVDDWSVAT